MSTLHHTSPGRDHADSFVIDDWWCPVCHTYTPRLADPGRPRVYCTNACRQRAYRQRKAAGIRLLWGDRQPKLRSRNRRLTHLMRPSLDPTANRRTATRRVVSLCGAFARPLTDIAHIRADFRADDANDCFVCLQLTGAGRPEVPMIYPWQGSRLDYDGPPVEPMPARPGYEYVIRGLTRRVPRLSW